MKYGRGVVLVVLLVGVLGLAGQVSGAPVSSLGLSVAPSHCWDLGEGVGARIDYVQNGSPVALLQSGSVLSAVGVVGDGALFTQSGTRGYLRSGAVMAAAGQPYTVVMWAKALASASWPTLFRDGGNSVSVWGENGGYGSGRLGFSAGTDVYTYTSYPRENWHLVALSFDGVSAWQFWVDAVGVAHTWAYSADAWLELGDRLLAYNYEGVLDTVAWFPSVLSLTDIQLAYNGGVANQCSDYFAVATAIPAATATSVGGATATATTAGGATATSAPVYTQLPYPTAVPQFTQIPYPTAIPSLTPTATATALPAASGVGYTTGGVGGLYVAGVGGLVTRDYDFGCPIDFDNASFGHVQLCLSYTDIESFEFLGVLVPLWPFTGALVGLVIGFVMRR